MKIQIDTDHKTIKIENDVSIEKLLNTLKKLFPNNEWKEFTLQTNTVIERFHSPIVVEKWREPYYPWWSTRYYSQNMDHSLSSKLMAKSDDNRFSLKSGVFNVEA